MRFSGPVATIRCFENNPLVRAALEEQGGGRVLVVDGGASKRCALLGDNIAAMAVKNGWSVSDLKWFTFHVSKEVARNQQQCWELSFLPC